MNPLLISLVEIIKYGMNEGLANKFKNEIQASFERNDPITLGDLSLKGYDLKSLFPMLEKNLYGSVLKECLNHVIQNPLENTKENLTNFLVDKISHLKN